MEGVGKGWYGSGVGNKGDKEGEIRKGGESKVECKDGMGGYLNP